MPLSKPLVLFLFLSWLACGCSQSTVDDAAMASESTTAVSGTDPALKASGDVAETESLPSGDSEASDSDLLTLGDPAPELEIANWVRGEAVEGFTEGSVYVVEFWATWCGPCKRTMPHISQLQEELGDEVTFIGVTDENESTVEAFFEAKHPIESDKTWGDLISYTIGVDDAQKTSRAFMERAQQPGIPTAFIVGRTGLVEWIGHPAVIDEPLEQVIAGTYDVEQAREEMEKAQRTEREMQRLAMALQTAIGDDDKEGALKILDEMETIIPENPQIGIDRFNILLQLDRTDEAYESIDKVIDALWEHADFLEFIAVRISDDVPETQRRLDVAQRAAGRAVELTNRAAGALDALARVHYRNGELNTAVELQTEAVEASGLTQGDFQDRLDEYVAEQEEDEPEE